MSELDLLKFLETYAEEAELADFSPEELRDFIEQMQAEGMGNRLLTKEEFKERYFEYYDDVKDKSLKKQDW